MALAGGNGMFAAVDHPGVELASVRKALMLGFARDYYSNRPQMQAKKCGPGKEPHQKVVSSSFSWTRPAAKRLRAAPNHPNSNSEFGGATIDSFGQLARRIDR